MLNVINSILEASNINWRVVKMGQEIKFRVSVNKAIEVIVWLAKKRPNIDIYHVAKMVFLAEKEHLNRYARSIVGDRIKKFDNGPAPSMILDLINLNDFLSPEHRKKVEESIKVDWSYPKSITALRDPDMSFFSGTNIECLEYVLEKYGDWSFDKLFNLTHSMRCFEETIHNDYIDYALLIDEDNPNHDEIIAHLRETASCLQV
jgi:uncharacterized phage-associated protein